MPEDLPEARHRLLADIAEWYYMDGLSQEEIAKRVDLSRPSISRLLLEARELGIVEITVNRPVPTVSTLEQELRSRFSLQSVRVLERKGMNDEEALRMLGRLGQSVLDGVLQDGMVFGLSWGTSIHAVIQALRPRLLPNVKVVQVIGGIGAPYRSIDGLEQVRRAAEMFGAQHYYLNAPLLVDSPEIAAALRNDHSIYEVLELAKRTDVAMIGIGSTNPEVSTQYHSGYITYEDLRRLDKLGVVGAMCMSFFNIKGEYIPTWFNDCAIGVSWEDMTRFGTFIAIGGGRRKAPAILGAARTGLVDFLVTDDIAAETMLRLIDQT
jgi:DNA-binding transcriptional regulator LsrR (DeoR family)